MTFSEFHQHNILVKKFYFPKFKKKKKIYILKADCVKVGLKLTEGFCSVICPSHLLLFPPPMPSSQIITFPSHLCFFESLYHSPSYSFFLSSLAPTVTLYLLYLNMIIFILLYRDCPSLPAPTFSPHSREEG